MPRLVIVPRDIGAHTFAAYLRESIVADPAWKGAQSAGTLADVDAARRLVGAFRNARAGEVVELSDELHARALAVIERPAAGYSITAALDALSFIDAITSAEHAEPNSDP